MSEVAQANVRTWLVSFRSLPSRRRRSFAKLAPRQKNKNDAYIERFAGMSAKDIDFTKDDEKRARHGPDVQILEGDHVSCIQCHRLHSRLCRILKSTEMDEDYGLCDEATKQKIMADGPPFSATI